MPEIKNTFSQGKMNKDLDERLIPSGQYRHAENVEVTSSEDAAAGTVQNILGNTRMEGLVPSYDESGCTCVGSIANDRTNKLYWFIKCQDRDAILEFDQTTSTSIFMAVDLTGTSSYSNLKPFLSFTGGQITGINIIDDFLFWTDGQNEPKKLNISKSSQENPSAVLQAQTHAWLHIGGNQTETRLEERHVTVIRKRPSIAPTTKINTSKNVTSSAIFEKIFPRFCLRYKYRDGEYSAFGPFTEVVFNPEYDNLVNSFNAYSSDESYNKAMVNLVESIELYDFIPTDIPEDVVQVDILYKQENSPVIYSIANIKYTDSEWLEDGSSQFSEGVETRHKGKYVIASENLQAALPENQLLRAFDIVPKSALAQEVIGNRIVYGNYKQGYDFEDNKPGVNASQELRDSQDFNNGGLKSLKSLREYQLGVVLGDEYGRETPVLTSKDAAVKVNWNDSNLGLSASKSRMLNASLTSTLPEWVDYYKFYVKSTSGEYYNMIMDKSYFPFTHSSSENLDEHFYISFPSADRNKVIEGDYIIAKKIYDGSDGQVIKENKYKILDIKNEAPDAVKYTESTLGQTPEGTAANDTKPFYHNSDISKGKRIDFETDTIHICVQGWLDSVEANSIAPINGTALAFFDLDSESGSRRVGDYDKDFYISWENGGEHSSRYNVSDVTRPASIPNADRYVLKLSEQISSKDARLASTTGLVGDPDNMVALPTTLKFKITRRELRGQEDFSGKFFVKIKHDTFLTGAPLSSGVNQLHTTADAKACWLYGHFAEPGNGETTGIVNSASESYTGPGTRPSSNITEVSGIANTEAEWDLIFTEPGVGRTFFIDDMYFISSNPATNNEWYAKEAGEGWFGAKTKYRKPQWASILPTQQQVFDADENGDPLPDLGFGWSGSSISLTPVPSYPNSENEFQDHLINSMEGIVETTPAHSQEARRWVAGSIYGSKPVTTVAESTGGTILDQLNWTAATILANQPTVEYDQTYTEEDGKFFMHLSFLAPGVDLVTIQDLDGVKLQGKDSIASLLQGVWGGGVFTKTPLLLSGISGSNSSAPSETFGDSELTHIEFEGNYSGDGIGLEGSPSPLTGKGYDEAFTDIHVNQWNPAFTATGHDASIQSFITKLKTANSKFKFKSDINKVVYTVKSVQEKHLYNHTSWRMRWLWDGSGYERGNNSVEEAASAWANTAGTSGEPEPTDGEEDVNLIEAIEHFGAANNRRTCYVIELDKNPAGVGNYDPRDDFQMTSSPANDLIQFLTDVPPALSGDLYSSPTIWETEPQQLSDLNIYYEASGNIPTRIEGDNREIFAPQGCRVKVSSLPESASQVDIPEDIVLSSWDGGSGFTISHGLPQENSIFEQVNYTGAVLQFYRADGSYTKAKIFDNNEDQLETAPTRNKFNIEIEVNPAFNVGLNWFNCFSFGNGIESNRIRDGFNEMQISSGARASATLEEPFAEEHRANGLIYSGIYNSNSGVNNLNQFVAAEKITKDLNPTYGSIQKLFARSTDLVALCEDRVLKILANKDALFNADGNPQLVSNQNVLGQAVPFVGDYGISTHPESFASESYRAYFADKQRGAVLRLSMDGLTPISDAGMRDYFRDNLVNNAQLLGSYNGYSKHYNLTIKPKVFTTPIVNDDISSGELVQEFIDNTDLLTDGALNIGSPFQGDNTVEELITNNLNDANPSISIFVNPDLNSTTTVINHQSINVDAVDPVNPEPPQDAQGPQYEVNNSGVTVLSFSGDDGQSSGGDALSESFFSTAHGGGTPRAYIQRWQYHGGSSGIGWYEPGNDGWQPGASGLGGYNGPLIFFRSQGADADSGQSEWDNNMYPGIEFFSDTNNIENNQYEAYFIYPSSWPGNNNGDNNASNPPATGLDIYDTNSAVPSAVQDSLGGDYYYDNSAVTNMTVFDQEEISIEVDIQYNEGGSTQASLELWLMDNGAVIDDSVIISTPNLGSDEATMEATLPELEDPGEEHFTDNYYNQEYIRDYDRGWSSSSHVDFNTRDTEVFGYQYQRRMNEGTYRVAFKFGGNNSGDRKVIENLQMKWQLTTSYHATHPPSMVITGIRVKKHFAVTQPPLPEYGGVGGVAGVQSYSVPAWTEVQHDYPMPTSTGNPAWQWNLNYANELLFGVENPPEVIALINNNGDIVLDEYGNSVTYNQGSNPLYPNGTPVPLSELVAGLHDVEGDNSIVRAPAVEHEEAAVTTMNFLLNDDGPIVAGNWYLVDVNLVDEDGNQIIDEIALEATDLQIAEVVINNTNPEANFQAIYGNTGGFFGEVSIPATTSPARNLKLLPAIQSEYGEEGGDVLDPHRYVLRGLFKANINGSLPLPNHIIQIENRGEPVYINSVEITNITDTDFGGGNITHWEQDVEDYTIERAFVENTSEWFSHPQVYYKGGFANFYNAVGPHDIKQEIPSLQATTDGYKLSFTIKENSDYVDEDGIALGMSGKIKAKASNQDWRVSVTLDQIGDYEMIFNFTEDAEVFVKRDGESITPEVTSEENTSGTTNFVQFQSANDDDTYCSVSAIELVDITNYFSLTGATGEGIESWVIEGFDQTDENFITWSDGAISFLNAPEGGGVMVFQPIEDELLLGQTFNLSFNATILNGQGFEIMYYNPGNTAGFNQAFSYADFPGQDQTQTIQTTIIVSSNFINDETGADGNPILPNGCLIIRAHDQDFTGTIDNIFLNRIITESEFESSSQTISFSEDAKGWVSFKSYIPESALSLSNRYFTMDSGMLWEHNTKLSRNNFYDISYRSAVTAILNQEPSVVKSFNTINYEGSQAAIESYENVLIGNTMDVLASLDEGGEGVAFTDDATVQNSFGDGSIDSANINGWSVGSIVTDSSRGSIKEFIEKEGKWFNYIKGEQITAGSEIDTSSFSFQGLGVVSSTIN